jgi:hypothetical protein
MAHGHGRHVTSLASASFTLACLVLAAPVLAHHSAAMFDSSKEVVVEGVVTEYAWKNPHSYLTVRTATGIVVLELGPPSTLGPLGLKKDTIKVGDQVKVRSNPPRTGTLSLARVLVRADGTTVPLNISAGTRKQAVAQAESLAGVWVPEGFFGFLQSRARWPLNNKGKAALQAADANANISQNQCIPVGAPMVMLYPTANRIEIARDVVRIHVDWMDAERVVYLDGRKPPANAKPTMQGFSTGKWEGKTLVVDTTQFAEHREGNGLGMPSGPRKHLVERFTLTDDRQHLTYEFTLEDPDLFTAPIKQSIQWDYRPDVEPSGTRCDVGAASRYLKGE